MPPPDDDTGALERARHRLYETTPPVEETPTTLSVSGSPRVPHEWQEDPLPTHMPEHKKRHLRFASIFFGFAMLFFLVSLGVAAYVVYYGGNTVAASNIDLTVQGPASIAAGDTVPLVVTVTNKNLVAVQNAKIEIAFPEGTRNASNTLEAYPRYEESLGDLASGSTITRTLQAVIFGAAGDTLTLHTSFSYGTTGSNATFVKKSDYPLAITSTPLEVKVDTLTETVSGKPFALTLTVRSNASVPLDNVVLAATYPYGFTVSQTSVPSTDNHFVLGTLAPGEVKTITVTGVLTGQANDERAFHFSIGTAKSASDPTLAITYMTQQAVVAIATPFISATISVNGDSSASAAVSPGTRQNVTVSYANTLATNVSNVTVLVALSGAAVDYNSVTTTRGFYRSVDHTVVFSPDKDSSLANLAPGASGLGTFSFSTLPSGAAAGSPSITLTTSISGTRAGQSNVPEQVQATMSKTVKVLTAVALTASSLHASGPIANTGPIPPQADLATTYSVVWNVKNPGSAVAGAVVTATLPNYVAYTSKTAGDGNFSYDSNSRLVTWTIGDLAQGATTQGVFQVVLTPSTSQKNTSPPLTGIPSFSGYDRFAGAHVKATGVAPTIETKGDPGYVPVQGSVAP
ncbi:hypothetical protein COU19_02275 [Candidatus Kaiserbacteria bacterium CG10_big_fil_rev_8_21_14_0_10_56_12]|uniref:DUF11 domain-containing protein n=1 Tax=Candidatus Kaiserbacteria bacterium CG10_big_fil_rev_8_21_14_0_10_56_12 TaxID=1974611 RepID=A0A2H0U9M8_9BACT|nr:MAG: hypothetical protein COU19_02275 [Candidatus Kaiserbacteria bacterium CG10_big_fil_rev_8_21_14_0_10_56_12]